MKLFVWEDVLQDYTSGIVVAFAETEDEAWKLIAKNGRFSASEEPVTDEEVNEWVKRIGKPRLVEKPEAFIVWGGG
jgi:hypothetical protein